jgi:diacylglycerol kinase family enzyme
MHDIDAVEVECDVPTPLQADGEDLGDAVSVRFEAERDALRVLVGDN